MDPVWYSHYEQGVARHLTYPDKTLGELFDERARRHASQIATNFVLGYWLRGRLKIGGTLTYRELRERIDRFASTLHALGVRKGDRVALMLPNSPHYVIAFYGALKIGAIVVNTNPIYTAHELRHQLIDSGAETIVLLNLAWPVLHEILPETAVRRVIVATIDDTLRAPIRQLVRHQQRRLPSWVDVPADGRTFFFQDLLDRAEPAPPPAASAPEDTALLQYTGGTTGTPKAAMLTHRSLASNTLQCLTWVFKDAIGRQRERVLAAIPFFHVYGLQATLLCGIAIGAELVIMPNPRGAENLMRVIQRERCSFFPGVPAMYLGIVNHPKVQEYDLRSIEACLSGSAPLPIEIQERFEQLTGGRLVEGFGMTECGAVTHANPLGGVRKNGSIGVPIPDTDARIVDLDTGADLPFDGQAQGELLVRGPQVMRGYWNRDVETAEALGADGWLRTGDICTVDGDGYFFIADRKKDMINVSGYKVLPREVEEVLFRHPKVLDAVVVGIPNAERGDDTVAAYIVPKPGERLTAEEIQAFCQVSLAKYKVPRVVAFRDALPKTMIGKTLRRALVEEELAKRQAAPPYSQGQKD